MIENNKSKEYLNDLNEWQGKMYSPGEYLGGKLPPMLKHGNRKVIKWYAWIVILILILALALSVLQIFNIL